MIRFRIFIFIFLIFYFIFDEVYASSPSLSLNVQHADLSEVMQILAKTLHINVMISSKVVGTVSLHLNQVEPIAVFDSLLAAHHLAKWRIGEVWFIAPQDDLIKRQEAELKWQTLQNESAFLITKVWQIKYAHALDIAKLIQTGGSSFLSKRGQVHVDTRTNTLCIQDVSQSVDQIRQFIARLDVPVKQILIEARLFSIDEDVERELGIHFETTEPVSKGNEADRESLSKTTNGYSLVVAKLANGTWLDVKLSALEKAGHAELISSPRLFTANQQPASIEAGEEVPYQEVSESGGTAVAFKKAVLALKVIPEVLPGNKILLRLKINQDRPSNKMVQGVPTISTRQIITNVLVEAGHTAILGGIYESGYERGQQQVPWVSRLPLIGWLFVEQTKRENKRELLIFVTPKMIT